ncbi:MAG TPA: efflux RND transporter periplasmic adaptor subunit [Candidatus Mailhella merdavium]|nr:efflux RND transporter periplasmic adaptor subunit [Candidatus Mailhella merdavium]
MPKLRAFAPLLLALPLVLTGCDRIRGLFGDDTQSAAPAMAGRTVQVSTVTLTPQTVTIERELTGRTSAYRWAEVRPEVSGILKELCFTEGAMVKEGDVLYRIEPDTYKAALNKARADLASAEANLKVTRLRERRTADMLRGKSVSQQDYDDAKAALQQAEATVQSCSAAVETAEINYRRTEVRAPISGRITISNFTVGALLTANQTTALATIYQTDPMYVEMSQSADDLYALKKQLEEEGKSNDVEPSTITALLTMADGSTYSATGHLNFTGVDVNQNTNTITLRAQFPNPDGKLLPGLFVNARVIMGEDPQAILVPQKSVLRDLKGNPYVYVLKDGKAERRSITLSRAIDTNWYVTDGLKLGEKVILNGVNNVRNGMSVKEVALPETSDAAQSEQPSGGNA